MKLPILFTFLFFGTYFAFAQEVHVQPSEPIGDTIRTMGEVYDGPIDAIQAPEGFEIVDYFNGYLNKEFGASILINEIHQVGYFQLENGMNEEYYAKNSFEFISKQELQTTSGTKGLIFKMRFYQREFPFIRYVILAGDVSHTIWMHVTYAEQFTSELDQQLLDSFKTVNFFPIENK